MESSPKAFALSLCAVLNSASKSSSLRHSLMPFPPPPELALIMIGKPISRARSSAFSAS